MQNVKGTYDYWGKEQATGDTAASILKAAAALRRAGIRTSTDLSRRKLKQRACERQARTRFL